MSEVEVFGYYFFMALSSIVFYLGVYFGAKDLVSHLVDRYYLKSLREGVEDILWTC